MSAKESEFFLQNLNLLMRSALPVREAIETLKTEIRSKKMIKAITIIESEIDTGSKISTALGKSGLLSERFVSLLRLGEETGELQKQLALIVEEQKKEQKLKSKIRGALMYPGIVLSVAILMGIFTMWYIFPKLTSVFVKSGAELPMTTKVLISVGEFLSVYGLIVIPLIFLILVGSTYLIFIYKKTRWIGETMLLRIPATRGIVEDMELARFGYIMGSLLKAGVSLPQALKSMEDSTSFVLYKRFYAALGTQVTEGHSLYNSMNNYPHSERFFPSYLSRLLSAGEMSGSLSETLLDIGSMYEAKTENLAQTLSVMLEPIIMVVVGLFVAFLAIAIIAPVYGITGAIK